MTEPGPRRHLILVGLPGAGKSTVARLAAARLETHCTDIDPILERATGLSIAELFAEEGEAAFRDREHRGVIEALELPPHLIAPGGGWASQPGNLEAVEGRAVVVHLEVAPATAAARLAGDRSRPLLAGADPAARLAELAPGRLPYYRRAAIRIDAGDRPAEAVADDLVAVARARAGWP